MELPSLQQLYQRRRTSMNFAHDPALVGPLSCRNGGTHPLVCLCNLFRCSSLRADAHLASSLPSKLALRPEKLGGVGTLNGPLEEESTPEALRATLLHGSRSAGAHAPLSTTPAVVAVSGPAGARELMRATSVVRAASVPAGPMQAAPVVAAEAVPAASVVVAAPEIVQAYPSRRARLLPDGVRWPDMVRAYLPRCLKPGIVEVLLSCPCEHGSA